MEEMTKYAVTISLMKSADKANTQIRVITEAPNNSVWQDTPKAPTICLSKSSFDIMIFVFNSNKYLPASIGPISYSDYIEKNLESKMPLVFQVLHQITASDILTDVTKRLKNSYIESMPQALIALLVRDFDAKLIDGISIKISKELDIYMETYGGGVRQEINSIEDFKVAILMSIIHLSNCGALKFAEGIFPKQTTKEIAAQYYTKIAQALKS